MGCGSSSVYTDLTNEQDTLFPTIPPLESGVLTEHQLVDLILRPINSVIGRWTIICNRHCFTIFLTSDLANYAKDDDSFVMVERISGFLHKTSGNQTRTFITRETRTRKIIEKWVK